MGVHLDVYDDTGRTRLRELKQLHALLDATEPQPQAVVVCGDFNALRKQDYTEMQWAKIVEHDRRRDVSPETLAVDYVQNTMGMRDCFAAAKQTAPVCSTWSGRRVDFIFTRGGLSVCNPFWYPCISSDHIPIACDVSLQSTLLE
jgi:endonuclease/exonuclease/phosphatase family metal-dependent hydrolase